MLLLFGENSGLFRLGLGATVLHLHLSRTLLWSPFDEIRTMAVYASSGSSREQQQVLPKAAVQSENKVLERAQRDELKACLAALYYGTLF